MAHNKEKQLLRLIEISKRFINSQAEQLSCQEIADYMRELSGGQYVVFNRYDANDKKHETMALSGFMEDIKKDQAILIKVQKDQKLMGDFTLYMAENQTFIHQEIAQLYASQVAFLMEKTRARREYEKSRIRFEGIVDASNIGTWEWNVQTNEIIFNEHGTRIIGGETNKISPKNLEEWLGYVNPEDLDEFESKRQDIITKRKTQYSINYRIKHKLGHWVSILDQGKVITWTDDGEPLMMVGVHFDISKSEKIKDEYERFFAMSLDLFCIVDANGKLINVNNSWERLLGYSQSYLKNKNVLDFVHPDDRKDTRKSMVALLKEKKVEGFINRFKKSDGSYRYIEWISQPYDDFMYASGRDVTEKHERQKEIEFLSFRDYLTGLYNRRYMADAINRLDTSRNLPLTIMAIDINGLKLTNDAFGHEAGDQLIKSVADIIIKTCRTDDVIGRIGGDEFQLILPNTDYGQAKKIMERMIGAASTSYSDEFIVSFAIGYAVKTKASQDITQIEKTADKNMYRHKSKYGKLMRNETIDSILSNIFHKDEGEQIHAERVSLYCEEIARAMGLSQGEIEDARIAGILHDIGKITISDKILNKPGKLNAKEWEEIKRHSITSYNILKGADEYASLAEGVLYHHERLDGKGYPEGLKENQIPLLSKIIAVADAYEAMTSERPYKEAKTSEEAVEELKKFSRTQFDPEIVEVFIASLACDFQEKPEYSQQKSH